MADAQARLPGLRPCGFHSPYEAAAWSVLSQRVRIVQAVRLRDDLVARHGDEGAFPAPHVLRTLDLDLPGRKAEYLRAVAEAALEGRLNGAALRSLDPDEAVRSVQQVKGLGPFAAELVTVRGANAPDALPRHESRLEAEVVERYGAGQSLAGVSGAWRPFRTCAPSASSGPTRSVGTAALEPTDSPVPGDERVDGLRTGRGRDCLHDRRVRRPLAYSRRSPMRSGTSPRAAGGRAPCRSGAGGTANPVLHVSQPW